MFGYGSSPEKKLAKKFNKILLFQTIKWKILKTEKTHFILVLENLGNGIFHEYDSLFDKEIGK